MNFDMPFRVNKLYMKKIAKAKAVQNVSEILGKSWVVRFSKNGVKVHKTFSYASNVANDREDAYQSAVTWRNAEWLSITHKSVSIQNTSQLTLRTLLEEYLEAETPKKKGAVVEATRINRILRGNLDADNALIDTPIVKLGRDEFSSLAAHLKNQNPPLLPSSINRYLAIFSSVFQYAMGKDKYKWIKDQVGDLAAGHHIQVIHHRKEIPGLDDLELVLAETESTYLKIAMVVGFETGARRGEIVKIDWADIRLEHNVETGHYPHIIFRDLKNGAAQKIVPLSQRAQDLLSAIDEDRRQGFLFKSDTDPDKTIQPRSITNSFRRARERTAKKHGERFLKMIFHGTRGNFITRAAQIEGISPLDIAAMSGHKDVNVILNHYYDPTAKDLAKKMGWTIKS